MNQYKHIINLTGGGLFVLTIVSFLLLSSPLALADNSATNDITINVPISCNLSSSTTTNHTATVDAGTYRTDIGESTITATCNDSEGFAIYAIGYSNDTHGNNTLINTTNNTQTIASGTATSGATSNWSMKLTPATGDYEPIIVGSALDLEKEQSTPDFSTYTTVPSIYTKVAYRNSVTDQTTGAKLKSTYAAYIAPTQYAGTYEGKVKYTLVHPNVSGDETEPTAVIIYNPNAADVRGTMNLQYASGETVLDAPNYARSGYGFAAWNTQTDGNGTNLGPNETIDLADYASLIDEDNNTITLYAKWVPAETGVTMQTFDSATHSSDAIGTVLALTDNRDSDTYAVAKLADGKWWMIENLRLDPSAVTFTADNTNNPYVDSEDSTKNFTSLAANTSSSSAWCTAYNAECNEQVVFNTVNLSDSNHSYGTYYNWFTATAGNGKHLFNTLNNKTDGDICPRGWHLPEGGTSANFTNSDFYKLARAIIGVDPASGDIEKPIWYNTPDESEGLNASVAIRSYPNNLLYSGRFEGIVVSKRGENGMYWSSTTRDSYASFRLNLDGSSVRPAEYLQKYSGLTVRCLAN